MAMSRQASAKAAVKATMTGKYASGTSGAFHKPAGENKRFEARTAVL
jgi:hypothetical protein